MFDSLNIPDNSCNDSYGHTFTQPQRRSWGSK